MTSNEEHAPLLVCGARQTIFLPMSKRILIIATNTNGYAKVKPELEWDSAQEWTTAPEITNAFQYRQLTVIVLDPTNSQFPLAKHQQISIALPSLSVIVQNKCDEPSANTPNPPLYKSGNLVYHQPHVDGFQKMPNHKQLKQKGANAYRRLAKWNHCPRQVQDP